MATHVNAMAAELCARALSCRLPSTSAVAKASSRSSQPRLGLTRCWRYFIADSGPSQRAALSAWVSGNSLHPARRCAVFPMPTLTNAGATAWPLHTVTTARATGRTDRAPRPSHEVCLPEVPIHIEGRWKEPCRVAESRIANTRDGRRRMAIWGPPTGQKTPTSQPHALARGPRTLARNASGSIR